MDLRHLEYFLAVADERSFTRAAARLHVVQSGVTAVIKTLERDLGMPLLERDSKRVALTEAGAAFLPRARAVLDAARAARDAVDEVRGGLRGMVRVGAMISAGLVDLPGLLGRFHEQYPEVGLQLLSSPSGSRGLVGALTAGSLDLALVSIPGPWPAGVRLRELASAPIDLMVPPGHRLAGEPAVSMARLADETFVDFPVGYCIRSVVDQAFAAGNVHRHVSLEVADIATGADCVRRGLGVGFFPRFVARNHPDLRILTVTGADLRWPLAVATPASRPPAAATRALLELIYAAPVAPGEGMPGHAA